jgi:CDGSH-type Zn-finger protein/uncharacterized Fe-S cluster protein YjdI
MSKQKVFRYPGDRIDVSWDDRLCIHVGECVQSEGDLFVVGRNPWCVPGGADKAVVRDIVERCPSGALAYEDKSGEPEQAAPENRVRVTYNGPLFVNGGLQIEGAPEDMPGVRFRAALCRCGHSQSKPFCDNSHERESFRDYGAVGERGPGARGVGGTLRIKPLDDGPLFFSGHLTIEASSGRRAWQGDQVALCRCGHSEKKPFCDGSHKRVGFEAK